MLQNTEDSLTLSNTKQRTDLGTLVVPFMQTFHLLHTFCKTVNRFIDWNELVLFSLSKTAKTKVFTSDLNF